MGKPCWLLVLKLVAELSATPPHRRFLLECSGACGDLGTFIPHVIGAMIVAGLAPAGVLFGFAAFLITTGLFYGLPLPVQPMKAISAAILTAAFGRARSPLPGS
jgi:Molybdate transporter of MFS superfamily